MDSQRPNTHYKAQSIMEINRAYYNPKAKTAMGQYNTKPIPKV